MGRCFNRTKFLEQRSRKLLKILSTRFVDFYRTSIWDIYSQVKDLVVEESMSEIKKHIDRRVKIKRNNDLEQLILEVADLTFKLLNKVKILNAEFIYEIVTSVAYCFHVMIIQLRLINFTSDADNKDVSKNQFKLFVELNKKFTCRIAIATSKLYKHRAKKTSLQVKRDQKSILNALDELYKTKTHYQSNYEQKALYEIAKYYHLNFIMLIEMAGPMHNLSNIEDAPEKIVDALEDCLIVEKNEFTGLFFKADGFYTLDTKTAISFYRIEKILMQIIQKSKRIGIKSYARHVLANRHRLYKRELSEDEKRSPRFAKYIQEKFSYTLEEKKILRGCKGFMKLESNAFKKNSEGLEILEKPERARKSLAKEIQKYLSRGE